MCTVQSIIIHTFDLKGEITHTADVRKRRYIGVVRMADGVWWKPRGGY